MAVNTKNTMNFKRLSAFLDASGTGQSRWLSFIGLATGVVLLLCSVQLYININDLLRDKNPRKSGYDFISVTKTITNENMGKDNRFNSDEVAEMKGQSFILDATPLLSNQFRAKASAGTIIPFSTDLFLEAIDSSFIDNVSPDFKWQPGQQTIPIIFSADFLEMYNVFAPAQDLPQISESTISSVNIILECYGPLGIYSYKANIVGVSDRINSVLVPESFLKWANTMFGNSSNSPASRVFIKTVDANNPALLKYIEDNHYHINKDKTKFGRVKQVLQLVVSGLGVFAILVILLAMMLFSFYLQLVIARSKDNLKLLIQLGFSPAWLAKVVARKWIPVYAAIIFSALVICILLQYLLQHNVVTVHESLSPYPHPLIFAITMILFGLCIFINYRLVKKLLVSLG